MQDTYGDKNPNWKGGQSSHPLYELWQQMIIRCHRPASKAYARYGARGIYVHYEWREDFWAFVRDVGERPEGTTKNNHPIYTLDRIDNDGPYAPGNVRWATRFEQQRNTRPYFAARKKEEARAERAETYGAGWKYTVDQVDRVRELADAGVPRRLIHEETGISRAHITTILLGKTRATDRKA